MDNFNLEGMWELKVKQNKINTIRVGSNPRSFFMLILALNNNSIFINKQHIQLYAERQLNQPKLGIIKPIQIRRELSRHFKGIVNHTERVSCLKRGV